MYDIVGKQKYFSGASAVLFIASVGVFLLWGLNLGIDFTGGTSMELRFPDTASRPAITEMTATLAELGISNPRLQDAGEAGVVLKMQYISNEQRQSIIDAYVGVGVAEESFNTIGPSFGAELKDKAIVALILVLFAIIGFVSYAFRKISRAAVPSWVFGVGAILALIHDIVLILGVFIVLGKFFDVQIDAFFVTALLTILGFSVNDTIVVYDRIREGLKYRDKKSFKQIINESINSTIVRSLNTSLTTLLVLLALYLFGGESIQYLILALLLGIIFGTYSSIFIASPMLLVGEKLLKK